MPLFASPRTRALLATSLLAAGCASAPSTTPDASTDVTVDTARDVADAATPTDQAPADVATDLAPVDASADVSDDAAEASVDASVPPPVCTPLRVEPASVRVATGHGVQLRAIGGSGRGALFTFATGAMTGGATLSPGGALVAGHTAATFDVNARDGMCSLDARARVEVVGPFVVEPTEVRVAPGRTMRFLASGALGAVRWEVLQRPATGTVMGDATLDAMGVFSSGSMPGIYRLRASDTGGDSEVQVTVTVATGATFTPASTTVLVPRGRRVRLDWRGGSRYVNATISGGSAGGAIAGTAGEVIFDATSARTGIATVSATDRYTNERATVRVVVGDEIAPPPVVRGPVNFAGDVALGDVNNDGRTDLVLGQANRSANGNETGGLVVFHGQADGRFRTTPDTVINGLRDGDLFGTNVLVRDVDGDRIDDVVVSTPTQDLGRDGRGSVQVFLGSPTGLVTTAERVFVGTSSGDAFGTGTLVDDLDGDGANDLVVVAPNEANPFNAACGRAGRAYLYRGVAGGRGLFQTVPWQVIDLQDRTDDNDGPPQCRAGSVAGSGLALIDMDGDGRRDLCVGAPGNGAPNFGSVLVYRGTAMGTFETAPAWTIHMDVAQRANNPRFGFGLDVVPVSATQRVLVVRVPTYGLNAAGTSAGNAGALFVFQPGTLGAAPTTGQMRVLSSSIARARYVGATANEFVGRSGAFGDLDGDGDVDYVVGGGAAGFDGGLYVFEASALAGSGVLTPTTTQRGDAGSTEVLGQRVAFGRGPMGMAAPFVALSAFRTTLTAVFGGSMRWLPAGAPQTFMARWSAGSWVDMPVLPSADRTGTSVAMASTVAGVSAADVVVGSPGAHSAPVAGVGTTPARAAGFRARTGGADLFGESGPSQRRFWIDRANAQLGGAVAVLDFDGDGRNDVAFGDPGDSAGGTDMITRVTPNLATTATDPCWLRTGATGTTVVTASVGGRGVVRIFLQNADRTFREAFWAIARESVPTGGTARRTNFGFSLANAGDVNGDGMADLLVGRSGGSTANGAEVILGRRPDAAGRISIACHEAGAAPWWDSRGDNTVFGVAVAGVGDLDDDGCADTAVSISGNARAGVSVQYGFGPACRRNHRTPHEILVVPDDRPLLANVTAPGGTPRATTLRVNDWADLPGANTGMGLVIAGGGDLNGDRVPDLAVRDASLTVGEMVGPAVEILSGAMLNGLCPEHTCAEGLVDDRFYSDGAGYNVLGLRTLTAPERVVVPVNSVTSARFGAALAVNDLDNDGTYDLIVGSPDDNAYGSFSGAVFAWRASSDATSFAGPSWLTAVGDVDEAALFGTSIATARDGVGTWISVGASFSNHRGAQTGAAYRWLIPR